MVKSPSPSEEFIDLLSLIEPPPTMMLLWWVHGPWGNGRTKISDLIVYPETPGKIGTTDDVSETLQCDSREETIELVDSF